MSVQSVNLELCNQRNLLVKSEQTVVETGHWKDNYLTSQMWFCFFDLMPRYGAC